ncbi:MAG: peptidylprolyl isomerase [Phycisphaerae bacterium]
MSQSVPFLILLLIPVGLACMDSDGNRTTLQQWWKNRFVTGSESAVSASESPATEPIVVTRASDSETGTTDDKQENRTQVADATIGPTSGRVSRPPLGAIRSDALLINNEAITARDILEPLMPQIEELSKTLPAGSYYERVVDLVQQQLKDTVAQRLIYRRARQTINDSIEPRIDKAVEQMERERINREFGGLETRYAQYLQDQNKTREEVRERLRRFVVVDSYLRDQLLPMIGAPRKRELMNYYRAHLAEFSKPERREMFLIDIPSYIFVDIKASPSPDAEEKAERAARASIDVAAGALADGRPFSEVAGAFSKGPHAGDGGAWGFISSPMAGPWKLPYERFVEMGEGEISDVIEVDHEVANGLTMKRFFIVKVGRVEGGTVTSFKDAQPEIVMHLKNQQFQKLKYEFLRKEFDRSTIGDLREFLPTIMQSIPRPTLLTDSPIADRSETPR